MNISGICSYETPCGWCSKWDKKCDKKIGNDKPQRGLRANIGLYEDAADIPTIYGKCFTCAYKDRDLLQCKDCNPENKFQYFAEKES